MNRINVAYVVLGPERSPGVHNKVASQVRALRQLGLSVATLNMADKESGMPGHEDDINTLALPYHLQKHRWDYYAYWRDAFAAMNAWIKAQDPDTVYMRYPGADPILYQWIRKSRVPVVFEHQSKYRTEMMHRGDAVALIRWGMDVVFSRAVLRRAAAHVAVTPEIALYVAAQIGKPDARIQTITNGIAVDAVPLRRPPTLGSDGLRMLFVGDWRPWHGLDRLMAGLTAYRGDGKITLVVIGTGGGPSAGSMPAGVRVEYQGRQTGKTLDCLFDTSHVAIAGLGVHRKGLNEAATLKVREYLARGIPFIVSHRDPDISGQPGLEQFVQYVPPDDTAVNIDAVIRFAARVSGDHDHAVRMRHWAQEHVDMSVKMAQLKKLLTSVRNTV